MNSALFVLYAIIAVAASTPIYDCGVLDQPFASYKLANDIAVSNLSYGFACFNIKGNGIVLDGNGFQIYSSSGEMLPAVGVQISGTGNTVTNLRVNNFRTGIHANGKNGKVQHNTITQAINGIDVTATHNDISHNIIKDFNSASEATSGIYVYFPAIVPVASSISITDNVISNIQGESFALGVSVYYATSVYIANNQIFNLHGGMSNEEISIIEGDAQLVDNVFTSSEGYSSIISTVLFGAFVLVASLLYFRSSSSSSVSPAFVPPPLTKSQEAELMKKQEKELFEKDGSEPLRVRKTKTLSFSAGSSPGMGK